MYISGSVLAVKENYRHYAELLKIACVDYIHIDIFQSGIPFSLKDLALFQENDLVLDLHLIYESLSDEDIRMINQPGVKYINLQYETLKEKSAIREISRKIAGSFGIALTSDTPLSVVDENINDISQVLIMASQPGVSGAAFDETNYERIQWIQNKYPALRIWVDGGVDNFIAEKLGKLKTDVIVSGSYLCNDLKNLYSLTYKLKYLNEKNIRVTRNMLHFSELPVEEENATFVDIITEMNRSRMGTVLIVRGRELKGIITDGDIRRAVMEYGKDIFFFFSSEFMNRYPLVIESDWTMEEVFEMLTKKQKRTDFIPVMEDGTLVGAVDLHIGR